MTYPPLPLRPPVGPSKKSRKSALHSLMQLIILISNEQGNSIRLISQDSSGIRKVPRQDLYPHRRASSGAGEMLNQRFRVGQAALSGARSILKSGWGKFGMFKGGGR